MAGISLLNGLTDTQAILGCAGLTSGDVSDSRLMLSLIEDDLQLNLYARLPQYQALLAASELPDATPQQKMIGLALRNYVKWDGASILAARWGVFKKMMSDGKVRNDRFDRMDLADLQANVEAQRARYWAILIGAIEERPQAYAVPTFFGKATPVTDPVTDLEP